MPPGGPAVNHHLRHLKGGSAIQKNLVLFPFLRHHQRLAVGSAARVKGVGHEIGQAERMGQMHRPPLLLPRFILQTELPAAVPDHSPADKRNLFRRGGKCSRHARLQAQGGHSQHECNSLQHGKATLPRFLFFQTKNISASRIFFTKELRKEMETVDG